MLKMMVGSVYSYSFHFHTIYHLAIPISTTLFFFFFFFNLESLLGNHRHIFLRGSCWFVKFGCTPRWLKTLLGRARMALVRHGAWPGGSSHRNCGMNREAARYKWPHAELLMRACWMASESN